MSFPIRQIQTKDLPSILDIQAACYPIELHEEYDTFLAKLQASPETNWLIEANGKILGYLFCHPWRGDAAPELNRVITSCPEIPDRFYLHDLAIHPQARGQNLSISLAHQALQWAQQMEYQNAMLVAVEGAEQFWQKLGFEVSQQQSASLSQYGNAKLMLKKLGV
ncbi:GNAT family N-acetyltransferase [Chitinibacter bivalviorum]|uniref:GNAT family N-acetyltransferase n=1 Tax=Chitinibacter bivalviorum TaxID=2739434 RepID=A0A7H9BFX4_9NEIS|nr:GNAT family N-acetyltransferase [Chitinibacter bivalviorum]QLG87519.1 GNAT family N-acetyltransferase [Chitinibacter bivalviorum]